jgi:hypothetical protein
VQVDHRVRGGGATSGVRARQGTRHRYMGKSFGYRKVTAVRTERIEQVEAAATLVEVEEEDAGEKEPHCRRYRPKNAEPIPAVEESFPAPRRYTGAAIGLSTGEGEGGGGANGHEG